MIGRQTCQICGKEAFFVCSQCQHVFYCNHQHQVEHWRVHREHCSAFKDHKMNKDEEEIKKMRQKLREKYLDHFMHKMYDECIKIANQMVALEKDHIKVTKEINNQLQLGISICLLVKNKQIIKKQADALMILKNYLNEKMHFLQDLKDVYSCQQPQKYEKTSKQFSSKKASLIASLANISYILGEPNTMKLYHIYADHIDKIYGSESFEASNCYFMMGTFYFQKKSYHKAISCFLRAAKLRKKRSGDCYYNLGIIFFLMKKPEVAIQMFQNARAQMITEFGESSNQIADIHHNLALIYQSLRNYPQAIYNFQKIILIYSKDKNAPSYKVAQQGIRELQKQIKQLMESKNQAIAKIGGGDFKTILQNKLKKNKDRNMSDNIVDRLQKQKNNIQKGPKLKLPQQFIKTLNPLQLFHLSELQLEVEDFSSEYMVSSSLGRSKFLKVLRANKLQQFRKNNLFLFRHVSTENLGENPNKNPQQ